MAFDGERLNVCIIMPFILKKSDKPNKKFMVIHENKKIYFGDSKYQDYTQHNDDKRKSMYILRHKKNEDWNDKNTSGFWARWILWEKKTIDEAIKDLRKKNVYIIDSR